MQTGRAQGMIPTCSRSNRSLSSSTSLERALPNDENARQGIMAFIRERIAQHLENGHSFARATVKEPIRDRDEQPGRGVRRSQSSERIRLLLERHR